LDAKQRLLERLQRDPEPNERDELERGTVGLFPGNKSQFMTLPNKTWSNPQAKSKNRLVLNDPKRNASRTLDH
jgi:hypothetical protein